MTGPAAQSRRTNRWRTAALVSLALAVVLAGAALATEGRANAWFGSSGWFVGVEGGAFEMGRIRKLAGAGWQSERIGGSPWFEYFKFPAGDWCLCVTLWLPAAGFLAASAVAALLHRRGRIVAGRCGGCGYDLAGLAPSAACPECGAEAKV
jgi:hypothetical protein